MGIGIFAYVFLRSPSTSGQTQESPKDTFKLVHFKALLTSPVIWLLAIANLLMVGSLEGFSDVWGVPYLVTAYGISKSDAAQLISFVFFGMLVGGPLLAMFSKKFGNYPVIAVCGFGMALLFAILLGIENYHWWLLASLFFTVGILCCYQVIVFAAGADLVAVGYLGVTIAFLNCINMLGGSFFHTCIGKLMDIFWTGGIADEGIKLYRLGTYRWALIVIPICASLGAMISCWVGLKQSQPSGKPVATEQ